MSNINLIFITNDFAIDPCEISSLESYDHYESGPSISSPSYLDHSGTIVIQKNGRKTYLKGISVNDVVIKLKDFKEK